MSSDELSLFSITSRNLRKYSGDIQVFVRSRCDQSFGGNTCERRLRIMGAPPLRFNSVDQLAKNGSHCPSEQMIV
jgi:hypothetical protein